MFVVAISSYSYLISLDIVYMIFIDFFFAIQYSFNIYDFKNIITLYNKTALIFRLIFKTYYASF